MFITAEGNPNELGNYHNLVLNEKCWDLKSILIVRKCFEELESTFREKFWQKICKSSHVRAAAPVCTILYQRRGLLYLPAFLWSSRWRSFIEILWALICNLVFFCFVFICRDRSSKASLRISDMNWMLTLCLSLKVGSLWHLTMWDSRVVFNLQRCISLAHIVRPANISNFVRHIMTIPPPAHSHSVQIVLSQVGVKEPLSRTIFPIQLLDHKEALMPLARQVTNLANDRLKIVKVTLYLAQAGILTWTWRWTRCIWGGWWWRRGNPTRAPSCQPQAPPWCGCGLKLVFGFVFVFCHRWSGQFCHKLYLI